MVQIHCCGNSIPILVPSLIHYQQHSPGPPPTSSTEGIGSPTLHPIAQLALVGPPQESTKALVNYIIDRAVNRFELEYYSLLMRCWHLNDRKLEELALNRSSLSISDRRSPVIQKFCLKMA